MNEFEFDVNKSQANLTKHGIDFEAAQALWKDPYLLAACRSFRCTVRY